MNEFLIIILVAFFATNSLDKAESVELEETPLEIIDEIFGEGWWDNDKAEEWHKLTLEQNALHQIDGQNTQFGQIESNSTDQNPPLSESDHSDKAKNGVEQSKIIKTISSNEKRGKVNLAKPHSINTPTANKKNC
uniref:Secreted protein n=1 Tax=Globodera rostochiensis TaxID=31243 RepID=A0A914H408_GLORO